MNWQEALTERLIQVGWRVSPQWLTRMALGREQHPFVVLSPTCEMRRWGYIVLRESRITVSRMPDPPNAAFSSVEDKTRAQDIKHIAPSPGEPQSPGLCQGSSCWKPSSNEPSSVDPFSSSGWADRALCMLPQRLFFVTALSMLASFPHPFTTTLQAPGWPWRGLGLVSPAV